MAKSLLTGLMEFQRFLDSVSASVTAEVVGRDCTGYPDGAATPGTLVDFELTAPFSFGPPEGEGLCFLVPFESRGVASGQCKTSEGADYTYARDGSIAGTVQVELGPDALITAGSEQIMDGTILQISFNSLQVDDEFPSQGPPEKFAGEA